MLTKSRWTAVPPVSGAASTASPVWFGPSERPLFGWVHTPLGSVARGAAVLCPPLAREQIVTHYTYKRMAEELAAQGLLTVRFDYDGTGDSWGGAQDPDRVASWLASVGHAADLARRCGLPSVVLIGMRAGTLLAAASAGPAGAAALVLWDPCHSGARFIREQHTLQRLHFGGSVADPGTVELPGAVFSTQTVEDLSGLDAARVPKAVRAFVLTRPATSIPTAVVASLERCRIEQGQAVGQEQILEVNPIHQHIPLVTIKRIVTWVSDFFGGMDHPIALPPELSSHTSPGTGDRLSERALTIGPFNQFGIETTSTLGSTGPTALFVTSSFDSHAGPNRLWVLLARRWAAAGIRCVRFDLSGHGDSPSRPGSPEHVMRSPDAFDDLADAAGAVSPDDPSNVLWVGLCSGGYQVLEACLTAKARGVCVINPIFRFRPPELKVGPIDPRRRLCRPPSTISRVARRLPDLPVRSHPARTQHAASSWIRAFVESEVDALFICGDDEAKALRDEIGLDPELLPGDRFRLQLIPDLDHALMPASQRVDVIERVTHHVLSRFATQPRGADRTGIRTETLLS
jgi:alpha-beta hydrolase superfamily lysophospholipase